MKIIQVIGSLGDGGAERVVINLDLLFKKYTIESKIVVLQEKDFYDTTENTIINLNIKKSKAKEPLIKLLKEESADLILLHMQDISRVLKELHWSNIYNVIHTDIHERIRDLNWYKKFKKIRDFKKIYTDKHLITVSHNIQKGIEKLDIKPSSIQTIYNPFDFEKIQTLANAFVPEEKNYIVHVASLRDVKRQDILLRAFARANTEKHLLILGDGPNRAKFMNLSKELNIQDKVHFLGWVQNPYPYIKHADLFVLSSKAEGLPSVLIESLILHTSAVSTDCNSGPREILKDELKPYLSKVNDPDALSETIEMALDAYPKITPSYYENFSDSRILTHYKDLILESI
ncbi:MAG: glycosyltransferase [Sulfurimonas sp.]